MHTSVPSHVSSPPPVREDDVTIIFFTACGKCDLLSHSRCFVFPQMSLQRSSIFLLLCGPFKPVAFLHHFTFPSQTFPSLLPPHPSLWDGHLIHLTSWKDKYSLVECEAPASPLMQTRDVEKVSFSAKAQMPLSLILEQMST